MTNPNSSDTEVIAALRRIAPLYKGNRQTVARKNDFITLFVMHSGDNMDRWTAKWLLGFARTHVKVAGEWHEYLDVILKEIAEGTMAGGLREALEVYYNAKYPRRS